MHVAAFTDCVAVHTCEEETTVLSAQHALKRERQLWYTASAPVLAWDGVVAVGKATSLERAQCLCAMHAESCCSASVCPSTRRAPSSCGTTRAAWRGAASWRRRRWPP
ncbi:hypothetical protein STCU_11241 [Strigomonas culicis]|uniref:Uncharacterized protein n=1 Tax=Strigomonas culicis TaxID=28005 RepID=S9UP50_9TRYP|nr:hypothetical protein STCU_11241 [Strigomonas culicis]|eukprot:EPY16461.1 hypothetical protein STCU_11241 [Strigomonas culicis]